MKREFHVRNCESLECELWATRPAPLHFYDLIFRNRSIIEITDFSNNIFPNSKYKKYSKEINFFLFFLC